MRALGQGLAPSVESNRMHAMLPRRRTWPRRARSVFWRLGSSQRPLYAAGLSAAPPRAASLKGT